MKIIIKTTNLKLNQALKNFIEEKIGSLEKFSKKTIEAWVEIGKTTLHHQKGPFFRAECQIRFPGSSLMAAARSQDLKLAIAEVKDELQRQLKQHKNKLTAQAERKQRRFKKSLRLHPSAKFKRKKGARIREEGI